MKLKCIVVDDSATQRILITKLVNENINLDLIGDFANALEAKTCLSISAIDVIFLDIEMPLISGFDLLDGLKIKPQIIVISSKSDYAIKAFDYDATDFLQKPLSKERFNKAVKRAVALHSLKSNNQNSNDGETIIIKSNLKRFKVSINKIKWVEAFGDYIKITTDTDSYMVLSTMKAFENKLPQNKFVRIHKSYIVNIERIDKFTSKFAEISGTKIPISRTKKEIIPEALAKL
ncbi:LytR/AlgR family response regulator transcription factor [Flavobacterium sp.]|uniref:LytR/AlgR family response regulator transcription factor n=1 Tax=Flavobacterium sp. TaxID=239 RepID=UPI003526C9FD